ncbi:MAG: efflux RND transporter permease subunit [Deltaproteobacteria bacterium]|nr:MAG: efflux RND transporter permease subunit [Deltaproteobacteria bacterium]
MSLADICIRRPVFATMLIAALVVLGLFSYAGLGVDLFPNIDLPTVTVTTTLNGASVEEMETAVTKPIEEAINTIDGIDELRAVIKEGISTITIQFVLEKNGNVAAQEVRDKVSTVLSQLPVGTDPPIIQKFQVDAARSARSPENRSRKILRLYAGWDRSSWSNSKSGPLTLTSIRTSSRPTTFPSLRSSGPFRPRISRSPAAESMKCAASWCCGRWDASNTPRTLTISSWETFRVALS